MKLLSLDLGDQWVGIALSDASGIIARPYTTINATNLNSFLCDLLKKESIKTIVVGYPQTMQGTESDQTRKVKEIFEYLKKIFPEIMFVLWDERLSSKRAQSLHKSFSKADKLKEHARAAAFILDSYLTFLLQQKKD
jgi:putative holliday junction resolvase